MWGVLYEWHGHTNFVLFLPSIAGLVHVVVTGSTATKKYNLWLANPHHPTVHVKKAKYTVYECVSKSFRTGSLARELQMVQFSATRCSCIAIMWVSLVSSAAITLRVDSQWVFIVVSVYFVIDSVRKLLDTPVTNSMEQNPSWDANSHSASQEIPCRILLNPNVRDRARHWSLSWARWIHFTPSHPSFIGYCPPIYA
jgi:hypothetical protein